MHSKGNLPATHRIEYLDSLRGIGAVVVTLAHFNCLYPFFKNGDKLFNGVAAVSVFFVLSGYVLSLKLTKQKFADFRFASFTVRRWCRLWIPFAAALLLATGIQLIFLRIYKTTPSLDAEYLARWMTPITLKKLGLEAYHFYSGNYVAPSWTLIPELKNSLLLPLGIAIMWRSKSWFFFAALAGTYFNLLPIGGLHFALGAYIATHQEQIVSIARKIRFAGLGPLLFCAVYFINPQKLGPLGAWGIWAFASAALLVGLLASPTLQAIASVKPLQILGKCSFGIYLLHWAIMFPVASLCLEFLPQKGISIGATWTLSVAIFLAATTVLALFFYKFIEKPAISIGGSMGRKVDQWFMTMTQKSQGILSTFAP
ncbi:MAG: acyltransferase [Chthoniobacterales bacterium]